MRVRPADLTEIPRGAVPHINSCIEHGWDWRVTYARGTLPVGGIQWQPGPVVDGIVLAASKGDLRLWAAWYDGKFDCCWVRSRSRRQVAKVNSTDLKLVLKGELQ